MSSTELQAKFFYFPPKSGEGKTNMISYVSSLPQVD